MVVFVPKNKRSDKKLELNKGKEPLMKHVDTDNVEPQEDQNSETEDIYADKQREEMLNDDEITASENAFMEGREMKQKTQKKFASKSHADSDSVDLTKEDYKED